ncbi:MAG: sigma-70 family RNA polymerase sigma factor [Myxococcales bacterium]|nr:sigma-70 family RNA polymerase sigma factor [Myxococcales bacterium]
MLNIFKPLQRQRNAFEREALPHLESLHSYALHLCRDSADADDLVQETYIKALQNFSSYQQGTNCRAWLFRILTNTYFNLRRTRRRHNPIDIDATPDLQMQAAEASDQNGMYRPLDTQLLDGVVSKHVQDAIDNLPPEFRSVLLLADLQDFSYKEIAEVLDCPVGTVMSRLYRARKAMQKQLLDHAMREGIVVKPVLDDAGVIDMDAFRLRAKRVANT